MKKILTFFLLLALAVTPSFADDVVPGDVIVVLRSSSGENIASAARSSGGVKAMSSVQSFAQQSKAQVTQTFDALSELGGYIFMVIHSDNENERALLERVSANPNVVAASLNRIYHFNQEDTDLVRPNDYEYPHLWGMEAINAPYAWKYSTGSNDVYVAVLDSGIDYNHPDLKDNFVHQFSRNFGHSEKYNYSADAYADEAEHGTHVAGTIGAVGNNTIGVAGVNWNVKMFSVRVLDENGYGTEAGLVNGLNHVSTILRDNPNLNLAALNFSIGGAGSVLSDSEEAMNDPERLAFKALSDTNRIVISLSAGNSNIEVGAPNYTDFNRVSQGSMEYPSSFIGLDNAIVVAAAMPDLTKAGFSSYGRRRVHVAAPGEYIYSTAPANAVMKLGYETVGRLYGYQDMGGTSMAAPHVAGAAALLKSIFPKANAPMIKEAILAGADNSVLCEDNTSMYGLLDLEGSIQYLERVLSGDNPPVIVDAKPMSVVAGQPYNFNFYASGTKPITWSIEGELPAGLSFDNGHLFGVTESTDNRTFMLRAENDYGYDTMVFTVNILEPTAPVIRADYPRENELMIGESIYNNVTLSRGTWPFVWEISESSDITDGSTLLIVPHSGLLNFVPKSVRTYKFTVKVSNLAGSDTIPLTINVSQNEAPVLDAEKVLKRGVVGRVYGISVSSDFEETYNIDGGYVKLGDTIDVTGGSIKFASVDNLPEGMYFESQDHSVSIFGEPESADTYKIKVTVSNDAGIDSRDYTLVIGKDAPSFLVTSYDFYYGRGVSIQINIPVLGAVPLSIDYTGTLPDGISFDATKLTAIYAGTPTKNGAFKSVIVASNDEGSARVNVTINIGDPVKIVSYYLPDALVGEAYDFKLRSLGNTNAEWTVARGNLPAGLTLSKSGDITGTPTEMGEYIFNVKAVALDSVGLITSSDLSILVLEKPVITAAALPQGKINTPYEMITLNTEGSKPVWWSLNSGAMPAGLTLASNGYIYGTPVEAGRFTFGLLAENSAGSSTAEFTVAIANASGDVPGSGDKPVPPTPVSPDKPAGSDTIHHGTSRGYSSLTENELGVLQNNDYIAAVLPLISVDNSGMYSYESESTLKGITLSPDVPAGYLLVWRPFVRTGASVTGVEGAELDEESTALFYNVSGDLITTVPANHIVNISAWFDQAKTYAPVIAADRNSSGRAVAVGPGTSGGCSAGMTGLLVLLPLCAVVFRKHSR